MDQYDTPLHGLLRQVNSHLHHANQFLHVREQGMGVAGIYNQ